jgi:hypothetical protein
MVMWENSRCSIRFHFDVPGSGLPDALVGLIPVVADPFGLRGDLVPPGARDVPVPAVVEIDRVHELAVDVELKLPPLFVAVLLVPDVLIAVAITRFVRWYRRRSRQAPHP